MIKINAILYKVDKDRIYEVLLNGFGHNNIQFKARMKGEEFRYVNSIIEFYCYPSFDKKWECKYENYLIDVEMKTSLNEALNYMKKFTSSLEKQDVVYEFEYEKLDKDDCSLSDEVNFRHPKYDDFMKENY